MLYEHDWTPVTCRMDSSPRQSAPSKRPGFPSTDNLVSLPSTPDSDTLARRNAAHEQRVEVSTIPALKVQRLPVASRHDATAHRGATATAKSRHPCWVQLPEGIIRHQLLVAGDVTTGHQGHLIRHPDVRIAGVVEEMLGSAFVRSFGGTHTETPSPRRHSSPGGAARTSGSCRTRCSQTVTVSPVAIGAVANVPRP